ncbi:DUF2065 domain-containing protein [Indioceanicola profundi]|uniref:DUF2065 domain-containing protein n=1 Tax=Indioceanicola profundi TaxID=2220096 RepID=UPI000E6AB763|nr:DUF2065 domain-containing protein [Indioceanicola profundi]
MIDLLTALALVLVIEGLLYAAAPDGMRRMAAMAAETPSSTLRTAGLVAAIVGVALVWLLRP